MNRRSFLSFFGIAPAALVLPKAVLEPLDEWAFVSEVAIGPSGDEAWLKCARLGFELRKAFPGGLERCEIVGATLPYLDVHTYHEQVISFPSDTKIEDAIAAVQQMQDCQPGRFVPLYVGGRMQGITQVSR